MSQHPAKLSRRRFLAAQFPPDVKQDLTAFLEQVRDPLAVRSSSLLEDSLYQPFTGVYDTFMLANNHARLNRRVDLLVTANMQDFNFALTNLSQMPMVRPIYDPRISPRSLTPFKSATKVIRQHIST